MRFLMGLIVGCLLTVGAAYIHDSAIDPAKTPEAQAMVNWPVVSQNMRALNGWVQDEIAWLGAQLHRVG